MNEMDKDLSKDVKKSSKATDVKLCIKCGKDSCKFEFEPDCYLCLDCLRLWHEFLDKKFYEAWLEFKQVKVDNQ